MAQFHSVLLIIAQNSLIKLICPSKMHCEKWRLIGAENYANLTSLRSRMTEATVPRHGGEMLEI